MEAADVACLHLFCVPICISLFASVHVDSVSCSMHVPVICCLYHSCFFFPCLLLHQSLFVCPFLRSTGWCPSVRSISVYVSCLLLLSLPVYCESLLFFFFLSPAGRCLSACSSEDSPISLISASQAFLRAVYFCIYCSMMVLC